MESREETDKLPEKKKSQEENFCRDVNILYFDWGGSLPGYIYIYMSKVIHVHN